MFVHGCFWHGHPGCSRATVPKRNREFWVAKFEANRERDRRVSGRLRRLGYAVSTIWECEIDRTARLERKLTRLLRRART